MGFRPKTRLFNSHVSARILLRLHGCYCLSHFVGRRDFEFDTPGHSACCEKIVEASLIYYSAINIFSSNEYGDSPIFFHGVIVILPIWMFFSRC